MKALLLLVALYGCIPARASGAEVGAKLSCWGDAVPPMSLFVRRVCERREQRILEDVRENRRGVEEAKVEVLAVRARCDALRALFDDARTMHHKALMHYERNEDAAALEELEHLRERLQAYGGAP